MSRPHRDKAPSNRELLAAFLDLKDEVREWNRETTVLIGRYFTPRGVAELMEISVKKMEKLILEEAWELWDCPVFVKIGRNWRCPVENYRAWARTRKHFKKSA